MSGILFLGNDDFHVRAGEKGNMLCMTGWKGLALVMFYSIECKFCTNLIAKFKQLPTIVNGCKFGMVCVNRNMDVVEKSKNTIAPIEYVPDVILFVDGVPYIRYDGPHDIDNIKTFIFNVYERLQKTCFSDQPVSSPAMTTDQQQHQQQHQQQQHQQQQQQPVFSHDDIRMQQQQHHNIRHVANSIPEYTIGIPVKGNKEDQGRCYLEFKTAYPNRNQENNKGNNLGVRV
jgi:hypothetical protein